MKDAAMPDQTPNLALPWLMPAQAQKHVTVNEALGRLDALVQTSVESRSVSAEPASPTEGQAWLIPAAASGASWAGFDEHDLAYFQDGAWHAVSARTGQLAYIRDENALFVFDGNSWVGLSSLVTALGNLELLGVGTTADASNPFTARLNNALWTARPAGEGGTGDIRLVMNKETGADTQENRHLVREALTVLGACPQIGPMERQVHVSDLYEPDGWGRYPFKWRSTSKSNLKVDRTMAASKNLRKRGEANYNSFKRKAAENRG
ncbi:DUF2793 domain-containing protein [Maricaulaceae bacterium NA33B04]|nr:DUF2793 domain-containing protein [Maricaulaceae bacterium NA33B04]